MSPLSWLRKCYFQPNYRGLNLAKDWMPSTANGKMKHLENKVVYFLHSYQTKLLFKEKCSQKDSTLRKCVTRIFSGQVATAWWK